MLRTVLRLSGFPCLRPQPPLVSRRFHSRERCSGLMAGIGMARRSASRYSAISRYRCSGLGRERLCAMLAEEFLQQARKRARHFRRRGLLQLEIALLLDAALGLSV